MSTVETFGRPAAPQQRRGLVATALLSWLGFCLLAAGLVLVLSI